MLAVRPELTDVIANLLSLKSSLLREMMAILYQQQTVGDVVRVRAPQIAIEILSKHISADRIPEFETEPDAEILDRGIVISLLIKAFTHRAFRMLSRRICPGVDIVRAWVDVTFEMFPDEVQTSQIRVFPFPLRPSRQAKFIKSLRSRRYRWSFDGLPYSLARCIAIPFLRGKNLLNAIARVEHQAFSAYAKSVAQSSVPNVYTSDEFEVGSIASGNVFHRSGIRYVNSAHGVGFYCPRVCYNEFRYITTSQKSFYEHFSPGVTMRPRLGFETASPRTIGGSFKWIVFIHQRFLQKSHRKESEVELEILQSLSSITKKLGLEFVIKSHPNSDDLQPWLGQNAVSATVHTRWDEIDANRCVFVTISSTAFYRARDFGPVLVYKGNSFFPEIYLDGSLETFDLSTIEEKVVELVGIPEAHVVVP